MSKAQQEMFEAFQAFLESREGNKESGVEVFADKPARKIRTTRKSATRKSTTRKATKATKTTKTNVITCGEAWALLGADPAYEPSNPSAPARNRQLWALNERGLLAIRK